MLKHTSFQLEYWRPNFSWFNRIIFLLSLFSRWLFNHAMCTFYAFCGVLFGLCSLTSLTALSTVCCMKVCYPAYGRWDMHLKGPSLANCLTLSPVHLDPCSIIPALSQDPPFGDLSMIRQCICQAFELAIISIKKKKTSSFQFSLFICIYRLDLWFFCI